MTPMSMNQMALVDQQDRLKKIMCTLVRGVSRSLIDILNFCHIEYMLYPKGKTIGCQRWPYLQVPMVYFLVKLTETSRT